MADVTPTSASTRLHVGHLIHDNTVKDNARAHYGDVYGGVVHNNYNYATVAEGRQQNSFSDLIRWLNAPDPTNDHYEAQRRYEEGTGSWFLDSEAFQEWLSGDESLLWLYGPPGCCKTILCSAAIERTKKETCNAEVACFYFTFRDARKQTYENFLRSIIAQLARQDNLRESLRSARDHNRTHHSTLQIVAIDMIQQNSRLFLLVDGLDECPETDHNRSNIMEGLNSLMKHCPNLKLLVASRPETDIDDFMENDLECKFFGIQAKPVDEDINLYVSRELNRDRRLRHLSSEMKTYIATDLTEKAGGMFRWADLQLDSLKRLKVLRPQYIRETLKDLPRTLDETYDRILLQLDNSKEVLTVLRWVASSGKNSGLSVMRLREAGITDWKQEPYVDTDSREAVERLIWDMSSLLRFEEDVNSDIESNYEESSVAGSVQYSQEEIEETSRDNLETCSASLHKDGLEQDSEEVVESYHEPFKGRHCKCQSRCKEDSESGETQTLSSTKVSFAHRSVQEYLTSDHIEGGPAAEFHLDKSLSRFDMAQTCIAYLLHVKSDWERQLRGTENSDLHQDRGGIDEFMPEARLVPENCMKDLNGKFPLLEYAANYWIVHQYYAEGRISVEGYADLEPLVTSFLNTSRDFLRMLCFDIESFDMPDLLLGLSTSLDGFPVVAAAVRGLTRTIAGLVEADAGAARTPDIGLALIAACWMNKEGVVEYLLEKGVGMDESTDCTRAQFERLTDNLTGLSNSALTRQDVYIGDLVTRFIQAYRLLDPSKNCRINAFCVAVIGKSSSAIDALCKAGVSPNTFMGSSANLSALQYACGANNDRDTIESLLKAGADPNSPKHGIRPLWIVLASDNFYRDHIRSEAVDQLLSAGADPNSGRDDGKNAETALQVASRRGLYDVVKMLRDAGARYDFDIEPHGQELYWGPLRHVDKMDDDERDYYVKDFLSRAGLSAESEETRKIDQSSVHLPMVSRPSVGIEPWRRFQRRKWHGDQAESNSKATRDEEELAISSDID